MLHLKYLHAMYCGSLKKQIRRIKHELLPLCLSLDRRKVELLLLYICMRVC